jgi:flavodoxin
MTHMLLTSFLLILGCSSSQMKDMNAKLDSTLKSDKVLIVYLSRTNNTKTIAEIIHKNTGGTLVALELEKPYPENYRATVEQVVRENETDYLPPPMKSFLKQYDLSGKTIVPFNTNDGYGIGSSFDTVKELCPKSKILDGFSIKGGTESDGRIRLSKEENVKDAETKVKKWLQEIKLTKEAK